mgnify:CR=1 FL=1|tara:strand:- start:641 stop:1339 length:699 start_codon:yes stop_codon:yes gene_type:complete
MKHQLVPFFIACLVLGCDDPSDTNHTSTPDASVPNVTAPDAAVPNSTAPDAAVPEPHVTLDASVPHTQPAPDASVPNASGPDAGTEHDCTTSVTDILQDTEWGADAHGYQRFQFNSMAPTETALTDGSHATSHFTIDFEEDGFDFAYFIECQYDNGDYALTIADYYSAWVDGWDPSAGVNEDQIKFHYVAISLGTEGEEACLYLRPGWMNQSMQEREEDRLTEERDCWPRID